MTFFLGETSHEKTPGVAMNIQLSTAQLIACRRVAMEQNEKLFTEANDLNRQAYDLLDHPDFNSDMFMEYLQLRKKFQALFCEAMDHLALLNEQFPEPAAQEDRRAELVCG
jgi:hypothetical protein